VHGVGAGLTVLDDWQALAECGWVTLELALLLVFVFVFLNVLSVGMEDGE